MGFVKNAVKDGVLGMATGGIYPSVKYGSKIAGKVGGFMGMKPHYMDPNAFVNPQFSKEYATDQNRSNFYNTQARSAMGHMGQDAGLLNRQSAGYNPLIRKLVDMRNGVGPSLAQMQLEQGTNRNIQNQMGLAASNQGFNPAMAARMAGQNIAGMNQDMAGQAGQLRLQEQMDAMQQEMAARGAQSNTTGMAGNLYGNQAQLGTAGGLNYQHMAEGLAESERAAKMAQATGNQAAYENAMSRRLNFLSKMGQAAGALATGGTSLAATGASSATTAAMPQSNGIMPGGGPGLYNY